MKYQSTPSPGAYCKFGNFHENLIFANSVKRHICDVQISRLRPDLPLFVNHRVILLFLAGLVFTKLKFAYAKFRENKALAKISEFTVFRFICIISTRNIAWN